MPNSARHILVVDDSAEFLAFMQAMLDAEGFGVDIAADFGAARRLLSTRRPDLVISDVRLPGVEPFGILDVLAASDQMRGVPVLFCTAGVEEVRAAADRLNREGVAVLFKPFDIDDLFQQIACLFAPGNDDRPARHS
ncbi:MAG: response regulator [Dehalococcoidia bacterium]